VGTVIGRVFQEEYEYAWFALAVGFVLLLVLVAPVTLLIGACMDMEEPFGNDAMDMPGLSYVTAAAEQSLALVAGSGPDGPPRGLPRTAEALNQIATLDHHKLGSTGTAEKSRASVAA
jgi:hypothetical protein